MYLPVDLPAGAYANGTPSQAKGRWRLTNLVRWPNGANLQPVGGWVKKGTGSLAGSGRAILNWKESGGSRWVGIGTNTNLYAATESGAISDITPAGFTAGHADAVTGGGYGSATYGAGTYGTARPDTASVSPASVWTLDTWGQNLVGCMPEDGKLYEWARNTAVAAAQIVNSPTGCNGLSVAAERFLFAYRGKNISWSDQGDDTVWASTALNQAGDQDIDTFGTFRCGRKITGAHLHFTEVDVWRSQYQGLPTVFGFERAGEDCGIISTGSPVSIDQRCVWMGRGTFYLYNGYAEPLASDVADYVFADFNFTQASKVTGWHNSAFGEVWWHYPSGASNENDRYVYWNYRTSTWAVGEIARTAGCSAGVFQYPILVGAPTGQSLSTVNLIDTNAVVWAIGVDTLGEITATVSSGSSVSSVPITDGASGYWSVSVDVTGALVVTASAVAPGIPNSYILKDSSNNYWSFGIDTTGAIVSVGIGASLTTSSSIFEHESGHAWDTTPFARTSPLNAFFPDMRQRIIVRGFVSDEATLGESQVRLFGREFPNSDETEFGPYPITQEPTDFTFSTRYLELQVEFVTPTDSRVGVFELDVVPGGKR